MDIPVNKETILKTIRPSRKAYIVEYGCSVLLVGMLVVILAQGIQGTWFRYGTLALAVFAFSYAELSRALTSYKITPSKIILSYGILRQTRKHVHFDPLGFVPDISTKQNRLQRLLNYGSVYIASGDNSFVLDGVNRPRKVMSMVEDLIDNTRRGRRGADEEDTRAPKSLLKR